MWTISGSSEQLCAMVGVVPFYRWEIKAPRDSMILPSFHCEWQGWDLNPDLPDSKLCHLHLITLTPTRLPSSFRDSWTCVLGSPIDIGPTWRTSCQVGTIVGTSGQIDPLGCEGACWPLPQLPAWWAELGGFVLTGEGSFTSWWQVHGRLWECDPSLQACFGSDLRYVGEVFG